MYLTPTEGVLLKNFNGDGPDNQNDAPTGPSKNATIYSFV